MNFEGMVEVIRDGEIIRMPERQAIKEDLFILRKIIEPVDEVVYGLVGEVKKDSRPVKSSSRLDSWKSGRFNFSKNNVIEDLVPNFHWEIVKIRRMKNISRKQLAFNVGVSEGDIKSIELGELPQDDFILISRIESYLGINLRKNKVVAEPVSSAKNFETKIEPEDKGVADGGDGIFGKDIEILE